MTENKMKHLKKSLILLLAFCASCSSTSAAASNSGQNDVMIHQLRVELEEMKHHIHTTVMQMNILTNKMVNSEDQLFELKQRELIQQKQMLEKQQETLSKLEKKVDHFSEQEEARKTALAKIEEDMKMQTRALHQNKKKIHELEKSSLAISPLEESAKTQ